MEKTWENFWLTGKVTDYLEYRNKAEAVLQQKEEKNTDGTSSFVDRYGTEGNACK